ncbi:MAG: hypothetical protein NVS4B11_32480 [Ktedonobacteraceae bacterium]
MNKRNETRAKTSTRPPDTTNGPFHEIELQPEDTIDSVIEGLRQFDGHQCVFLILPEQGMVFHSEEDFERLLHLQSQPKIQDFVAFVIPPRSQWWAATKMFMREKGFHFGDTREAALRQLYASPQVHTTTSPAPILPAQGAQRGARSRGVLFALLALVVVLAAGTGTFLQLQHTTIPGVASTPTVFGHAAFANDQQGGINDTVQLRLPSLPSLPTGQVYLVWLLSDSTASDTVRTPSDTLWLSLGELNAQEHTQTRSPVDGSHSNLFVMYSRLCITASLPTRIPSTPTECHYYGEVTQQIRDNDPDHYSFRDHVRHLLSYDPTLESFGIHNGLSYNFAQQISKINEWASAANGTTGDMPLVHRHMVRILDALDGSKFVTNDVPAGRVCWLMQRASG